MTTTDPRPLLTRVLDQVGGLLLSTDAADLGRPTPCDDWQVRTLLNHVIGVHHRIAHTARGGLPEEITSMPEIADPDRAGALATARADLDAVWADDAVLDRVMTPPWGSAPGREVALGYAMELSVHAWDLAAATGRVDSLDPELAEQSLAYARRILPADFRGGPMPFGEVVEIHDPTGPYDELVAWLGRDPYVSAG